MDKPLTSALGRRVMGTFISSAYTLRTVQQVSALVPLTGGWMPQPGHPIPSAALRGASYSMPMFLRPFFNPQRPNYALEGKCNAPYFSYSSHATQPLPMLSATRPVVPIP